MEGGGRTRSYWELGLRGDVSAMTVIEVALSHIRNEGERVRVVESGRWSFFLPRQRRRRRRDSSKNKVSNSGS